MGLFDGIKHAWNAFSSYENHRGKTSVGPSYSSQPFRTRLSYTNERSIISSIYTRVSIDAAAIQLRHVQLDEKKRYKEVIDSGLNSCLDLESNIDQGPRAFLQDIVMTMFDKGAAAVVPVNTSQSPEKNASYNILDMRVGEITEWFPKHVRVRLYNEKRGKREDIIIEKRAVAIVPNPLYSVMNEPNSTLKRLNHKLNLLDAVDEQSSSGKLDLIIQLPYVIKSDARRKQADQRRADIEMQLKDSKYGIAYADGTEKITQLNRPAENNLFTQVEYLTKLLYEQLGITEDIMSGTADEAAMLNYYNRTVEPVIGAIVEAFRRTFLGVTGVSSGETIQMYRDPFKLVPMEKFAEISDKLTRNEILTSNEIRHFLGLAPSSDPKADKLINSNMPDKSQTSETQTNPEEVDDSLKG